MPSRMVDRWREWRWRGFVRRNPWAALFAERLISARRRVFHNDGDVQP